HALGPDSPATFDSAIRVATDRDSVIELFFEDEAALARLASLPEYQAEVRPDEAYFNDLTQNIMVKAKPHLLFEATHVGRCKRFDFLVRADGSDAAEFAERVLAGGADTALDPWFTASIDRLVFNVPGWQGDGEGFGSGTYDCVIESWAADFAALKAVTAIQELADIIAPERSFTVYATEFIMIPPPET
ncbi:MAG: EthD domain-containing protein, partial [Novosphingobium sp.]